MGCLASTPATRSEDSAMSPRRKPRNQDPPPKDAIQLVLIGQGESGKSTVCSNKCNPFAN